LINHVFKKDSFAKFLVNRGPFVIDTLDSSKQCTLQPNPYLRFYCMVVAARLHPHKDEHNQAVTMFFAGCTQQEVVSAFGVDQINVQQLHVRLH
jgi:hypothetical protein